MKEPLLTVVLCLRLLTGFEPVTSSLPRYNPKQKGHCPPQHTPSKSLKHHNILCFFFPQNSLAVSHFSNLTAKYSQSRFQAVFPRFFPPFKLPVSALDVLTFHIQKWSVALSEKTWLDTIYRLLIYLKIFHHQA